MPSVELMLAFALATAAFAYFPGPALLYTAAQTLARGRRAGLMAALGIHIGCYAHVLAATFGLSAVFRHVPELYAVVKIVGALYLVWLGIGMMRRKGGEAHPAAAPKSARRAFVESMIVEILNPKVAIFFIAFLPQFVDPAAAFPVWLQFLVLGTIVNFSFSSADIVTVFAASAVMGRLRRDGPGQRIVRYAGGSILIGLGAKLASDR
ncbi:LysE family translocator [Chelatococcus sp. SYSU_G07232]|uniref:LysE family translocator n=1 Tax=Chelatococcus albus TaxID=3047466 RepID=A0ABT7AG94_9HYPH|nr:LysE family translocator [Chelatococcus sp. SYSU_G07232]MDJ1158390.1 LysE family translocator [Chelatococcus sp. SYSU_G07232]